MALFMLLAAFLALGIVGLGVLARGGSLLSAKKERKPRREVDPTTRKQITIALVAAVVVFGLTRWPSAALAAGVLVFLWPRIAGGNAAGRRHLQKMEAIAAWTESLRDAVGAAAGLEQAIPSTLTSAPSLLLRPLRQLSARLQGRVPLEEALGQFADDIDDASADMVLIALALNSKQRSGGLARILTGLAKTSRDELDAARRAEHERKAKRRQALIISAIFVGFAVVEILTKSSYIKAYSTPVGQVALFVIVGVFTVGLMRIRKLSEPDAQPRFLISTTSLIEVNQTSHLQALDEESSR